MTPTESSDKKLEALIAEAQNKLRQSAGNPFTNTKIKLSLLTLIQTQREALKNSQLLLKSFTRYIAQEQMWVVIEQDSALDASNKTIEGL